VKEMVNMSYQSEKTSGSIGVCGALGVAFVVLKLCGVIGWSWWWVLAPFWVPPVAVLPLVAAVLFTRVAEISSARKASSGRTGTGGRRPPGSAYEPVHGWTRRQLDDYLARNPAYRAPYEAELAKHR
jgi:hypothetical protein